MKHTALLHRTVESGHVRRSPLAEVEPNTLALLRPVLAAALRLGREHADVQAVEIERTRWHVAASETADTLTAKLWCGDRPLGEPHISMTVRRASVPELVASMIGMARLPPELWADAALEAGDLERCLAWAWLTRDD